MAKKKTPDVDPAIVLVEKTLVESLTPKVQAKLEHYQQITAPMRAFVVTNEASCNVADELLLRVLQEKDGLEAVRVSGPGALGVLARKLNAIFKPPADVLDQTAAYLKKQIGEYKVAQRAMQAVNYQAAAQAHIVGDHTSASNKLAAAAAAETETARGTSVGEKWTVASIDAKTLPREWMIPDEKRIAAHARNTPADVEPAPIAGVVFVKEATVSKRRN